MTNSHFLKITALVALMGPLSAYAGKTGLASKVAPTTEKKAKPKVVRKPTASLDGGVLLDITAHRRRETTPDGKVVTTVYYTQN